jgi:hypothetical protein
MRTNWRIGFVLVLASLADAGAQTGVRITAAGERLIVRRCAEAACAIVAELPRGQTAEVLATEHGWYRVLVMLDGARATTGWVEIPQAVTAPRTGVRFAGPSSERQTLPARGPASTATPSSATSPPVATGDCLTCVATRTPTSDEWQNALAAASDIKGIPAGARPAPAAPEPATSTLIESRGARAGAPAATLRRDGRTSAERMRDDLDARFGDELRRLGEVAAKIDPDLQNYMATCYDRYFPIAVLPPGPTPPSGTPPPVRARATIFDIWRGRPAFAWTEVWSTPMYVSADSTTFCQRLWTDVNTRSAEVKAGVERVEAAARDADIFPGVVRDALTSYGLGDKK